MKSLRPSVLFSGALIGICLFLSACSPQQNKFVDLFESDLSNAFFPAGVWSNEDGVLSATEDKCLFTQTQYENFELSLEFMNDEGTNSGVIIYCSDRSDWIPNSIEIQIADDYSDHWKDAESTWQCAAFFGHKGADKKGIVKMPGEWNSMTIRCEGKFIEVLLNGVEVNSINLDQYPSAKKNPDGSDVPAWLSRPYAELETKGLIGFQGKHGESTIRFRNIKIKDI